VIPFVVDVLVALLLIRLGMAAVRWAKRQRGGAVLVTSLMLAFGMNVQIIPPPAPVAELVQRQAGDDEPKD
jgi:hypothetical protein